MEDSKIIRKDPFEIFPSEIRNSIVGLFSLPTLFSCTLVSKAWSDISSPALWRSPRTKKANKWKSLSQTLAKAPKYRQYIKRLDFDGVYYIVYDEFIIDLISKCSELRELIISDPRNLSDASIYAIG